MLAGIQHGVCGAHIQTSLIDHPQCTYPFSIRLVNAGAAHVDTQRFVEKRYGEAGYSGHQEPIACSRTAGITLAAYHGHQVVGGMTISIDGMHGLRADALYQTEIDHVRRRHGKVAEITRFALDTRQTSKRFIAALFNLAYVYVCNLLSCSDLVIEVNPAHASFYNRMLGFRQIGRQQQCPRVNAPAVLLWIDLLEQQSIMRAVSGRPDLAKQHGTLFPYFLGAQDELRLTAHLARHPCVFVDRDGRVRGVGAAGISPEGVSDAEGVLNPEGVLFPEGVRYAEGVLAPEGVQGVSAISSNRTTCAA